MSHLEKQLLIGTFLVTATVMYHVIWLIFMVEILKKLEKRVIHLHQMMKAIILVGFTGLFVLGVHISEIWLWAITFLQLDAVPDIESALYFSTVSATTVGYGDLVLDNNWRLLGSFEAMSGILVFGISTAFLMAVLRTGLADFFEGEKSNHK
jgi:hypothetical protein